MRNNTLRLLLLAAIVIVGILQIGYYYPKLPPTVASHFDARGKANDWMPKESFVALNAIVLASLLTVVLIMGLVIPRVPVALINLPHKEYWLAPERSRQTRASVFGGLLTCFNATGILLIGIFELAYMAEFRITGEARRSLLQFGDEGSGILAEDVVKKSDLSRRPRTDWLARQGQFQRPRLPHQPRQRIGPVF